MYILYLDDSGSAGNADDRHVILAGVAVPEKSPFWLSGELDKLAQTVWPDNCQGIEFRGSDMYSGRRHWRGVTKERRQAAYQQALRILASNANIRLFGAAIHKTAISPADPTEYAFEQLCNRFDRFLSRQHRVGNTQRGIIVLDESAYETTLQRLALEFRDEGHRWGTLHNIAEVPFFVNSRATRMIQFADLIAYSLRRYYEHGESAYIDIISRKFDSEGGVIHGLTHYVPRGEPCNCLACRKKVLP